MPLVNHAEHRIANPPTEFDPVENRERTVVPQPIGDPLYHQILKVAVAVEERAQFRCDTHRDNCRRKHLGTPMPSTASASALLKYAAHIFDTYC